MKTPKFDDFQYLGRKWTDMERKHLSGMQQITPKLFIQFLTEKGAKTSCLSCGRSELSVPHMTVHETDPDLPDYDGSNDWEYISPIYKDNEPVQIYNTRYEVLCSYCGFVSTYSAHTVVEWAKENRYIIWEEF
ncbi:hypothetical protein AHY55_00900 [Salmonella enterica subsp. enterica]|nr:hypothetical protein [Salmonella enterica subsp. enterica serovar Wandsworth]